MGEIEGYILRTRLLVNPKRIFYYKGTASEPNVSFAMNTIVALDINGAKVFKNCSEAMNLCTKLNEDSQLTEHGYSQFDVQMFKCSKG